MPKFNPTEDDQIAIPNSGYHFSAVKPTILGATEQTLATVVRDISGSVSSYAHELDEALKAVVAACQKSPRSENLLLRVTDFHSHVDEVHGFKVLSQIDPADYAPCIPTGSTALYDATHNAIAASNVYGKNLAGKDFTVNACVYILTDGEDNASVLSPTMVRKEIEDIRKEEKLDSLITVLVGINTTSGLSARLQAFQQEAGIDQYVDLGDATPGKLAKLAGFISKSISSSSQNLAQPGSVAAPSVTF